MSIESNWLCLKWYRGEKIIIVDSSETCLTQEEVVVLDAVLGRTETNCSLYIIWCLHRWETYSHQAQIQNKEKILSIYIYIYIYIKRGLTI